MLTRTSCGVNARGLTIGAHSLGSAVEVAMLVVDLSLGEEAPLPIPRAANARHSLHLLAPPFRLTAGT